jgi:hypothetical protein
MKWAKLVSCYLLAGILSATAILKFVEVPDDSLLGPVSARVLAVLELGLAWGLLRRQDFDRCLECLCSAILLDEVLDGLSLVSVDPAAERGEQEPQGEVVDHLAESSVVKWPM